MKGPWIEWKGGECPVKDGVAIDLVLRGSEVNILTVGQADVMRWSNIGQQGDITRYRLHNADAPIDTASKPSNPSKPMLLSADPVERKGIPITTGVLDYFPLAVAYVAKVSKAGNDQHNPGQPLHWDRTKSLDHADCIARHLIDRGSFDTDGLRHSGKLAWRALAALQTELEEAT